MLSFLIFIIGIDCTSELSEGRGRRRSWSWSPSHYQYHHMNKILQTLVSITRILTLFHQQTVIILIYSYLASIFASFSEVSGADHPFCDLVATVGSLAIFQRHDWHRHGLELGGETSTVGRSPSTDDGRSARRYLLVQHWEADGPDGGGVGQFGWE